MGGIKQCEECYPVAMGGIKQCEECYPLAMGGIKHCACLLCISKRASKTPWNWITNYCLVEPSWHSSRFLTLHVNTFSVMLTLFPQEALYPILLSSMMRSTKELQRPVLPSVDWEKQFGIGVESTWRQSWMSTERWCFQNFCMVASHGRCTKGIQGNKTIFIRPVFAV